MEVRVGNVETPGGGRQVFGIVVKSGTSMLAPIGRNLEIMGRNGDTKLTAFTDGCSGLRSILTEAGVKDPPILDWYISHRDAAPTREAVGGWPGG